MRAAKVIRELYQADHAFISKKGVEYYTKPFGFIGSSYLAKADPPGTVKGLTLQDKDGNSISELEGQDADIIAQEICEHLGVKYEPMWGRGSRLRVCCSAILEHLNQKAPAPGNAKTPEGV